ncbi:putative quinol monooxygenase [Streptomyces sp. NPDC046759]|uniref:putative quinol monooxygenase n=1 Tax=Streptomyces sp. NPDC046759 TaxID=3155019 RepID=UPI0033ECB9B1
MPVVIARLIPAPGQVQNVLDVYRELAPLVHQEPGCGLFALHTDGEGVFIVEHWLTSEDFQAHLAGSNLRRIRDATKPLLAAPSEIWPVESVPLGDPDKGVIQ